MKQTIHLNESDLKMLIDDSVRRVLSENVSKAIKLSITENLFTHDNEKHNLYDKLDELDIPFDFINLQENIIEIDITNEQMRKKVHYLLNMYGWKNIKETKECIYAERIYGDDYNDFYDTEADKDDDYPHGVGIYYHITPSYKVPKIMKQGLTVREGNKLGYKRGERIYLISYPAFELMFELNRRDPQKEYTILMVDLRKYLGKQINLYHDDFADDCAVYTYNYIPPSCISIYDKYTPTIKESEKRKNKTIQRTIRRVLREHISKAVRT